MTSTELVGPIRTLTLRDGTRLTMGPANTGDPRYPLCTRHHTGCDCYEAFRNEDTNEWRVMYLAACDATEDVLAGHRTFPDYNTYRDVGRMVAGRWVPEYAQAQDAVCSCTGCQIARKARLR